MTLVDFYVVLAHKRIATALYDGADLLSVLVEHLSSGPAVGADASEGAVLAPGVVPLHLEGVSSVLRNYLRLVFPNMGEAALLAETVLMLFHVANLLAVLPDDVRVGSVKEGNGGWQQALALHNLLVYFDVVTHIYFMYLNLEIISNNFSTEFTYLQIFQLPISSSK